MEVLVEAASEVPQGCFVSVRLGEHLKQRRFNKSSAKYYFPLPQEKGNARIDVYQLVGTCSVPVDPATALTEEVNVISADSNSDLVKLKVSTGNKDIKPEDAAKQRQEIEAETKDAAVGYLAKHGIEQKLAECLRTLLRMKPEDPTEFICKFLRGGEPEVQAPAPAVPAAPPVQETTPEVKPEVPVEVPAVAPPAVETPTPAAPESPPVETKPPVETAPAETKPEARASPDARAALMNSVRAGDFIAASEEEDSAIPFALRPSVGTWLMPLHVEKNLVEETGAPVINRRGSAEIASEVVAGEWLGSNEMASFNVKGLGKTTHECCEVERLLTKALLEMDGDLQGEYFPLGSNHPLNPGGLSASEKSLLESKKLLFESKDFTGRGVYLTEKEDVAIWINAEKHLQILVHSSAKQHLVHKIDMIVSALAGPLNQDGYTLSP